MNTRPLHQVFLVVTITAGLLAFALARFSPNPNARPFNSSTDDPRPMPATFMETDSFEVTAPLSDEAYSEGDHGTAGWEVNSISSEAGNEQATSHGLNGQKTAWKIISPAPAPEGVTSTITTYYHCAVCLEEAKRKAAKIKCQDQPKPEDPTPRQEDADVMLL